VFTRQARWTRSILLTIDLSDRHGERKKMCKPDDLLAAVRRLIAANEALGQMEGGITYYEASPTRSDECYKRWIELNTAMREAKKAANDQALRPARSPEQKGNDEK
jgi:hypothetical protein